MGDCSLLALIVTVTGLFGMISHYVSRSTHEIGLRMALGADRSKVVREVLGRSMRWVALGLVLGALASLGVTRLFSGLLYGISATDPITFVGTMFLMAGIAWAACYIPAVRAARIPPLIALH